MLDTSSPARIQRQITQRLSLRKPQEEALAILADILTHMDFGKPHDLDALLTAIQSTYPSVTDFERDFPSVCFALATGVGKTRLMGAFITYLFLMGRSRNFFVLAPNTTIYEKLIDDFAKQSSPKYVFRGIAQFAQTPPVIVTGDTWEEGRGVRGTDLFGNVVINIFNVDKINKDKGRIKNFRETIGDSYFEYLARLPDLVMLMDEAHRYRAKAGFKAIAELQPKLGIELTATPKTVGAKSQDFKNVIYDYGLGNAMADGFVKEPAVATRENFRKSDYSAEQLEKIMLEDGVHHHETVRDELVAYATNNGVKRVHPFMLVVAQDTAHASAIKQTIESDDFFKGAYRGRVIEVHSNLKGEEKEEAIERLLRLEQEDETDIVIHVNKLKEGWDVTNLYTIVPLRASASDILTEQTLGRGLRLPYGRRTGNGFVDRLTVIAHDRFDDVINKAREADSLVQLKTLTIGPAGDVSDEGSTVVEAKPIYQQLASEPVFAREGEQTQAPYVIDAPTADRVHEALGDLMRHKWERKLEGGSGDLKKADVQDEIIRDIENAIAPPQADLDLKDQPDIGAYVRHVLSYLADNEIEIPEIVVIPDRGSNFWFNDFDLIDLDAIRYQPMSETITIQQLRDEARTALARSASGPSEERLENYIVRHLIAMDPIDYDRDAELIYKLAGQVVERLKSYLPHESDQENVALHRGKDLAEFIFRQMQTHYEESTTTFKAKVTRRFRLLRAQALTAGDKKIVDISTTVKPLSAIRSHVFIGTTKSPYGQHKFDSDPERRFALMLDRREESVLRWLKPGARQFEIEYAPGRAYEPDFVAETTTEKLIVEIKASNELDDATVAQKSAAAKKWVQYANDLLARDGGKRWRFVVVPHDAIDESATLSGLLSRYSSAN